jgi:hypothetical protein
MAIGHLGQNSSDYNDYFLPRLTIGFGREILPLRFFATAPGRNGGITAAGAVAITGIGSIIGAGFLVRETVGLTFGMPEEYARVASGNKAQGFGRLYGHAHLSFPSPGRV